MPQPMPSVTEDYLKAIHAHTEWQSIPISSGALAARLGLAASTVTEMVKKLVAAGLVDHEKYGAIELTPAGTAIALMPGANTSSIIAKPCVRAACNMSKSDITVVGAFGP